MRSIFNHKKGVSPLIATILLIAFAVALGSVVMNWGLNLDLGKSTDKCRNVEIKIRNIDVAQVCFGGFGENGYINFIIDNVGEEDINGLAVWITGDKGTKLFDLNDITIKKGALFERKGKDVTYDLTAYGSIKNVQFIPKIKVQDTLEICLKNAAKAERIGICA